jgi:hypothetical protein
MLVLLPFSPRVGNTLALHHRDDDDDDDDE